MNPSLSRALEEAARAAADTWHGRLADWHKRANLPYGRPEWEKEAHVWEPMQKAAILAFLRHLKTTEEMVAAAIAAGPLQDNKIVRVTLRRAFSAMRDALIREMEKA